MGDFRTIKAFSHAVLNPSVNEWECNIEETQVPVCPGR